MREGINLAAQSIYKDTPLSHQQHLANGTYCKTYIINFTGRGYRKNAIWKHATGKMRTKLILLSMVNKNKASKLVGEQIISKEGLTGLYKSIIDCSTDAICLALKALANPDNFPILIHCANGKDRTGLLIALTLAVLGVEEDIIIADYVQSEQGLKKIHHQVVQSMAKNGLDSSFAACPPEALRQVFLHIKSKYGSMDGYLDHIGFTDTCRQNLRRAVSPLN